MRRTGFVDAVDGLGRHDHLCRTFELTALDRVDSVPVDGAVTIDATGVSFLADLLRLPALQVVVE